MKNTDEQQANSVSNSPQQAGTFTGDRSKTSNTGPIDRIKTGWTKLAGGELLKFKPRKPKQGVFQDTVDFKRPEPATPKNAR